MAGRKEFRREPRLDLYRRVLALDPLASVVKLKDTQLPFSMDAAGQQHKTWIAKKGLLEPTPYTAVIFAD